MEQKIALMNTAAPTAAATVAAAAATAISGGEDAG